MPITGAKIKGLSCFTQEFCGFDEFKLINVVIGRNNTGKSQLLKLIESLCAADTSKTLPKATYRFEGKFDEATLEARFSPHHSGGQLRGNHWHDHGCHFIGAHVAWTTNGQGPVIDLETQPEVLFDQYGRPLTYNMSEGVTNILKNAAAYISNPYEEKRFRHILADRDIRNEADNPKLALGFDGQGATNIIRDHLTRAENIMATRQIVQSELRGALNTIFGPDGTFTTISIQRHDNANWEIFLEEENKGLIPLSNSGSGLKTVILVLLNLLVVPKLENKSPADFAFAFEELENNLHPALLRRLLKYIEAFALEYSCPIFLTTHSSAMLDQFSRAEHAQFVRVSHDGKHATTQTISAHFDHSQVVGDLGARASDILQANGIIWVEGPSDAIYLNHWIDIFSEGRILEGRDYACAFYGGSLLARTTFDDPTLPNPELIKLIQLNRNAALICDSDKTSNSSQLKPRVKKAKEEMDKLPNGLTWITAGKEIETYLSGKIISSALNAAASPDPEQYELFFPSHDNKKNGMSYVEKKLKLNAIDKVELALRAREHMTVEAMKGRLDWNKKMIELIEIIEKWNA